MLSLLSIPVYFKEVFTTNRRLIYLNPNWSVSQLLDSVKPILETEFNCHRDNLEIIPSGQDLPGIPAEAGKPLKLSEEKIKQKWGNNLHIEFYIRRKNVNYPQLQNLNINLSFDSDINPIITNSIITHECPVCYDRVQMINRYSCVHQICTNCYYLCLNTHNLTCPICRSN